jgi:hypothetical protein
MLIWGSSMLVLLFFIFFVRISFPIDIVVSVYFHLSFTLFMSFAPRFLSFKALGVPAIVFRDRILRYISFTLRSVQGRRELMFHGYLVHTFVLFVVINFTGVNNTIVDIAFPIAERIIQWCSKWFGRV